MNIPRNLGHIWIGPKVAPEDWMQTWVDKHPEWNYTRYGNDFLRDGKFKTQPQIDEYMKRGWYAGAADLLRYEILYEHGGYIAGADSICVQPIDDLFEDWGELYTVYENEFLRGQLVAPIVAAAPNHPFLKEIIDRLSKIPPQQLDQPWRQTGNLFVAELIEELRPEIVIWPSHTLIPEHFLGRKYTGSGKVYAHQKFGETTGAYKFGSVLGKIQEIPRSLYASSARKRLRALKASSAKSGE
jgi:mannosyltransferase OCH1-like enzyme